MKIGGKVGNIHGMPLINVFLKSVVILDWLIQGCFPTIFFPL
jgi:hypothetical protein